MKKSLIAAGAASVALAAMPVLGVFAEGETPTPTDSVTDTIEITVNASCTFTAGKDQNARTYAASGTNATGAVNPVNNTVNTHDFTVFCNNNSGYKVNATATALNQSPAITDNFAYKATLPTASSTAADKKDGAWNASFSQASGGSLTITQLPNGGASTDIATLGAASAADGESFTATYTAWIGTETPAGTYSGTIAYTLTPNS